MDLFIWFPLAVLQLVIKGMQRFDLNYYEK